MAVEFLPSILSDICILEDQPDHIVVAVRISKVAIVGAMPFLAAVADRTGNSINIPISPKPVKKKSWSYAMILVAFAAAALVAPISSSNHVTTRAHAHGLRD